MQCYCIQQFHEQEIATAICYECERAICQRCLIEDQHKDHKKQLMNDFYMLCDQFVSQQSQEMKLKRQQLEQLKTEVIKQIEQTINKSQDIQFINNQPSDQSEFRRKIQQIRKLDNSVNQYTDKYFVLLSDINSRIHQFNEENWEINQIQEIEQSIDNFAPQIQKQAPLQLKDQVSVFTYHMDTYYLINEKVLQVFNQNMSLLYQKQYNEKIYRIVVCEQWIILHQFNKLLIENKQQQTFEINLQNQDLLKIRSLENKKIGLCFRNSVAWIIKLEQLDNISILNEKEQFVLSDICQCDSLIYISSINQPTVSIWREGDLLKIDEIKIDEHVSCMTIPQNKKIIIIGCRGFQIWNRIEKELLKSVRISDFVFDIQADVSRIVALSQKISIYDIKGNELYKGDDYVYEMKFVNKQILYTTQGVLKKL